MKVAMYHDNAHVLEGCEAIWNYIKGGHGVVTLESPSGKHYTYCFKKPLSPEKFDKITLFAYCIEGKHQYRYVGMLSRKGFRKTAHSEYETNSEQFKGAAYIIKMAMKDFKTCMTLYHEGVCSVCGKRLTKPESIVRGIGPHCFKHIMEQEGA